MNAMSEIALAGIKTVRASERLGAAVLTLKPVREALESLHELDPELEPELETATGHLLALLESLERAHVFVNVRFDAWMDQAGKENE